MSIEGGNYPPYREPCDGTAQCWLGPQWQNARGGDSAIPLQELSLELPNWDGYPSGSPAEILPYEKPAIVDHVSGSCEFGFCASQFGGTSPPCESWIGGDLEGNGLQYTLVAGQSNTAPAETFQQPITVLGASVNNGGAGYTVGDTFTVPGGTVTPLGSAATVAVTSVDGSGVIQSVRMVNGGLYFMNPPVTFSATGGTGDGAQINLTFKPATVDLAVCQKTGFKNVQARRFWHGRWSFGAVAGCSDTVLECDDGSQILYQSYQSSPVQTKYLSETRKAVGTWAGTTTQGAGAYDPSTGDTYNCSWTSSLQYDYEQTISVDPISGVMTLGGYVSVATHGTYSLTTINNTTGMPGPSASGNMVISNPADNYWVGELPSGWSLAGPTIDNGESSTGYIFSIDLFKWEKFIFGFDACGGLITAGVGGLGFIPVPVNESQLQAAINAYYAAINEEISGNPEWSGSGSGTFTYDDLTATGTFSATGGKNIPDESGGDGTYVVSESLTVDVSITISGANTAASVYADSCNLLGQIDLTDDRKYPWRTDGMVSISPLVTRNEANQNVSPNTATNSAPIGTVNDYRSPETDSDGNAPFTPDWTPTYAQINWFDPSAFSFYWTPGTSQGTAAAAGLIQLYDGTILGALNPAGYEDYFMFQYQDWRACVGSTGGGTSIWDWFQYGYGNLLSATNSFTGAQLPLNCTQWTNNYQSINKPPYAYAVYADPTQIFSDGVQSGSADDNISLWVCKYAEIKESWPSMNVARPGGDDKFAFDETQVYGATNIAGAGPGSTWTIKDPMGNTPATMPTAGILGGPVVAGFYSGCTYAAGVLVLGTLDYNVPSNWASASGDDTDTCLGLLRWPTAPALLGRIPVTVDITGMNFTFGVGQPNFGMAVAGTETIDIYDKNMNLIAAAVTATRVNDGTFTTAAAYADSAWVMIHGAPAWYFDDQYQKGDFLVLQSTRDYHTNGEYVRLTGIVDCSGTQVARPAENNGYASFSQIKDCLGFQPCHPRVICFSPNGESFPNGVTYGFPETFALDEQYGSYWQGVIQQVMDDPLWQVPHRRIGLDPSVEWLMANICNADSDTQAFYAHAPVVEAIMALPTNYGPGENETPPDPFGLYGNLAWESPVTNAAGPGVYFPPPYAGFVNGGGPAGVKTASALHAAYVAAIAGGSGCPFDYSNEVIV